MFIGHLLTHKRTIFHFFFYVAEKHYLRVTLNLIMNCRESILKLCDNLLPKYCLY